MNARSSCCAVLRCWKWRNVPRRKTVENPDCQAGQPAEDGSLVATVYVSGISDIFADALIFVRLSPLLRG